MPIVRNRPEEYFEIVVNTDGCCLGNGQRGAKAGYGVYCEDDERINFARRLDGKQTSQRAEIMAVRCGIMRAEQFGYDSVLIRTDSSYVVEAVASRVPIWDRGHEPNNGQDFRALRNVTGNIVVGFEWISRQENQEADELAYQGAQFEIGEGHNISM